MMKDCNSCFHCKVRQLTKREYEEKKSMCQTATEHAYTGKGTAYLGCKKRLVVWCDTGRWKKPYFVANYSGRGGAFTDKFGRVIIRDEITLSNCPDWEGEEDGDSTARAESIEGSSGGDSRQDTIRTETRGNDQAIRSVAC